MSYDEETDDLLHRVMDRMEDFDPATCVTEETSDAKTNARKTWQIPGITGATRLATDFGAVPAHLVRMRDKVRCGDGLFRRVLRIHEFKLDQEFLDLHPNSRPIVIQANTLGGKLPAQSVEVSPAQRVVLPSDWSKGRSVRADTMSTIRGQCDTSTGSVSYFSFDVGESMVLQCEGLWIDSYAGHSFLVA